MPQQSLPNAKPGDKPAEPEAEAKPVEPPAPIEYKYTIPETLKLDDAAKGELHKALDEFRANPADGVQKMVDVGAKMMTDMRQSAAQTRSISAKCSPRPTRTGTTKSSPIPNWAAPAIRPLQPPWRACAISWCPPPAPAANADGSPRMSEFQELCRVTGAGNHPVFWHMLHNAARYLDEPQARNNPTEIKPPADIGRNPNKRRGAAILYDNPRSSPTGADS